MAGLPRGVVGYSLDTVWYCFFSESLIYSRGTISSNRCITSVAGELLSETESQNGMEDMESDEDDRTLSATAPIDEFIEESTELLLNRRRGDFLVTCQGYTFEVHKHILFHESPWFSSVGLQSLPVPRSSPAFRLLLNLEKGNVKQTNYS